jgi:hypothetical protein
MAIVINPPAEWSTDQALDPETEVDLYRGWYTYTQMWPTSASNTGSASLVFLLTGGNGYSDGTYNGVAAVGGAGSGCTLNVTVSGGVVTTVGVATEGTNYMEGDYLTVDSANIGGSGQGLLTQVIGMGALFQQSGGKSAPTPKTAPAQTAGGVPVKDMLDHLPIEGLKQFAKINGLLDGIDAGFWKADVEVARQAVKEAYRLQQETT